MRHNQRLTLDALQREAAALIDAAGLSQAKAAERIGVSRQAVHRALNEENHALSAVLTAIIEALTDYTAVKEETVEYRIQRKG